MKKGYRGKHNKKCKFTPEEDTKLRELVSIHGEKDWEVIAKNMPKRNVRQCHDRWMYYLAPDVNTNEWTLYEEQFLVNYILEHGKKWTQVAKLFPGRNDIQIKNKWNSLKKRLHEFSRVNVPSNETATPVYPKVIKNPTLMNPVQEEPKMSRSISNEFVYNMLEELTNKTKVLSQQTTDSSHSVLPIPQISTNKHVMLPGINNLIDKSNSLITQPFYIFK